MRRYKRKIIVDKKEYIWTLKGNNIYLSTSWVVVTLIGTSYSKLYINPFIHDFEINPKNIALAIKTAKELGWKPSENSGDMNIELQNKHFIKIKSIS